MSESSEYNCFQGYITGDTGCVRMDGTRTVSKRFVFREEEIYHSAMNFIHDLGRG